MGPTPPPALPDALGLPSSPVSRVVYNGKRNSSPRSPPSSSEIFTPAHEENVRFIYEGTRGAPSQGWGSEKLPAAPLQPPQGMGSRPACRGPLVEGGRRLRGEEAAVEDGTRGRSGRTRPCGDVWLGCMCACAPRCP